MSWVWDHSNAEGTDRLVLLAIADSADDDGLWCGDLDTLARRARVAARAQVLDALTRLEDAGRLDRSDEGCWQVVTW